jgi:xanthine dehydrogenase accessory factor
MKKELLEKIIESYANRQSIACLLNIETNEEIILKAGEKTENEDLNEKISECIKLDKSKLVTIKDKVYFIDVYNPPLKLVIIGAVHIAQHLVLFAQGLNFDCILIDPRQGFANHERFPDITIYNNWPDEVLDEIDVDERTAIVTLTHDPKIDDVALKYVLKKNCFYIGSLGSKKTHQSRINRLKGEYAEEYLNRIHGPIGLNIGARTPVEIALSIMAEIIAKLRR